MTQPEKITVYKKVMVIDDNAIDRYVAEHVIKSQCFAEEVITKESARAGLEYLEALSGTAEELPQLIFLDIRMPEVDGFGFLELYDKLPEVVKKNCIIMMLSTSLNPEDHERAAENPFVNRFLNKPLNKEKLTMLAGTRPGTEVSEQKVA